MNNCIAPAAIEHCAADECGWDDLRPLQWFVSADQLAGFESQWAAANRRAFLEYSPLPYTAPPWRF